ncbi:MAG: cbb3-type cytochrome oxidase subunit 3 [Pseudomonadota bacterium]
MDLDLIRSLITVASLVCFLAICAWAYSPRARAGFEEAAQLPFAEEERQDSPVKGNPS